MSILKTKNKLSTFDREMQNAEFRKEFDQQYAEFELSEFMLIPMDSEEKTVKKLTKEVGLSPNKD